MSAGGYLQGTEKSLRGNEPGGVADVERVGGAIKQPPQKIKNMKSLKTLFLLSVISVSAFTLTAAEPLVSPHCKDAKTTVVVADSPAIFTRAQNALGSAALAKSGLTRLVRVSTGAEPRLVACKLEGKGSCPKIGTLAPCCQSEVASCK
jgi:hypothetical protein